MLWVSTNVLTVLRLTFRFLWMPIGKGFWSVYTDKLRLVFTGVMVVIASNISVQAKNIVVPAPHDFILQQDPILLWTKIISNASISAACFVLFWILKHFIQNRKERSSHLIFWLLSMVLIAFGILHIMQIWGLYRPLYWIKAVIEVCTAALAIFTTIALWPLVPKTLKLKGHEEFEKVNRQLLESESNFHLLVSGIKDYAIFMLDPRGNVITWNEGAERIKGYKANEIIGKNFSQFFLPEDKEKGKPLQILKMASENGRYEEEALRMRKDGSRFWANIVITALYDPSEQLTGFAKVTRDITEKRHAIQVLEEQAALFDVFNDAILVRNLDGTICYWNVGAEKMYGYSAKQVMEKTSQDLLKTESAKPLAQIDQDIIAKGHWEGELTHYREDGRPIIVESRQALKTDSQGAPASIIEINTDITDRKEAEQKQLALAEMERVNSELQQFAYIASHDLQEPLRAVAGCLQILEKRYKGHLDQRADELIQFAVDGAVRMCTLINDLLVLSRVDSENMMITVTDLQKVLDQVKTNLLTAIEESGAKITHGKLPLLHVNDTLLTMLFQNLISNAIKFRDSRDPKIHVDAIRKNGKWLFSIKDNGIGFDQKYANQIFQPFKRLHSKDEYPGTGIGLPICKRIVERHGGKIWADSQPGKGTTFHFTLTEVKGNDDSEKAIASP